MSEEFFDKRLNDKLLNSIIKDLADLKQDQKDATREIQNSINLINNRICVDNGKPSIQTLLVQHENRIFNCEKDLLEHKSYHKESSMLLKRPLISVIIASTFGVLTAFITSILTKIK